MISLQQVDLRCLGIWIVNTTNNYVKSNKSVMNLEIMVLNTSAALKANFERCTKEYDTLDMYTAWVGNPAAVLPIGYLKYLQQINVLAGVAFDQTHPNGIRKLLDMGANLRIARNKKLFHSKVYIFSRENYKAAIVGSSNFTFSGFFHNIESNVLFEGTCGEEVFRSLERDLGELKNDSNSFIPDEPWLHQYTKDYDLKRSKIKDFGIDDDVSKEDLSVEQSAWLIHSNWDIYLSEVFKGLKNNEMSFDKGLKEKLWLFENVESKLPFPWEIGYFKDLDRRRLIGGVGLYGFLGHVAASGDFRRLLANGTPSEQKTVVEVLNAVSILTNNVDIEYLRPLLNRLVDLGPTMKVWGRVLAIARPDIFCTISSSGVRQSISSLLGVSEGSISGVDGYLALLKMIYLSPWYNASKPKDKTEVEIWKRRVAFIDVALYV